MFVTTLGRRQSYAAFLRGIPDELPTEPPPEAEIKEVPAGKAQRVILAWLGNGKTVFADRKFLGSNSSEFLHYLTSEMLCRLYVVDSGLN